jgi:hypothetical protein
MILPYAEQSAGATIILVFLTVLYARIATSIVRDRVAKAVACVFQIDRRNARHIARPVESCTLTVGEKTTKSSGGVVAALDRSFSRRVIRLLIHSCQRNCKLTNRGAPIETNPSADLPVSISLSNKFSTRTAAEMRSENS